MLYQYALTLLTPRSCGPKKLANASSLCYVVNADVVNKEFVAGGGRLLTLGDALPRHAVVAGQVDRRAVFLFYRQENNYAIVRKIWYTTRWLGRE